MDIVIRGDKLEVTDAMRGYVTEKLSKIDKYFDDFEHIKATVMVKVYNHIQKVEITIPLKSVILRAEEAREDFYAAVDVIIDKLERQIRKNKTKLQSKKIKETKEFVYDAIEDDIEDIEGITKRKVIDAKPMSEEEALLQMKLLGHEFYLFKDSETLKPCVIYKRKYEGYGIIESE